MAGILVQKKRKMVLRARFRKKTTIGKVITRLAKVYYEPILVEAIVLLVKEQLNILRLEHQLPEITNAQVLIAVKDKIRQLSSAKNLAPPKWLKDIEDNG